MTDFTYKLETIQTDNLTLDYFLVPWDTEIMGLAVAEIRHLEVREPEAAVIDYRDFARWADNNAVSLCCCRTTHDQLVESMFLESQGFRFIELNYHPRFSGLQALKLADDEIFVEQAHPQDRDLLAEMAGTIFEHGRFHQDPLLGAKLGNRRYRVWLRNAFELAHQKVFTCILNGTIVAFFVVEYPDEDNCFWSLVGLAPGLQSQGLGKRVWKTMLAWHQKEDIDTITTSISSHNTAVFNLYVSLGFRFPKPAVTFHWRPPGALAIS